ncbi:GMC family oxidoreductase [Streptomyces mexicanus]
MGAGTAGCVLAARLSEIDDARVLLLEAGAQNPQDAMAVPSAWRTLLDTSSTWGDISTVQARTGMTMPLPRGKALGGSSSINGMSFLRGHRSSYDAWAAQGAEGWEFDDLLPYMRRSEKAEHRDPALRGQGGPLTVGIQPEPNPLVLACYEAAAELGYAQVNDFSGGLETGFGWCDNNVVNGKRQSAADAYLRPVMGRTNLDVITDALVLRLRIVHSRSVGVDYTRHGEIVSVTAGREVVVSAGAIGSAHLLLCSGVGPAAHLRESGVEVALDLPGVGGNLHDHPLSTLVYTAKRTVPEVSTNPPGAPSGLVRSDPAEDIPNLQIIFVSAPTRASRLTGPARGYCHRVFRSESAQPWIIEGTQVEFRCDIHDCKRLGQAVAHDGHFC